MMQGQGLRPFGAKATTAQASSDSNMELIPSNTGVRCRSGDEEK